MKLSLLTLFAAIVFAGTAFGAYSVRSAAEVPACCQTKQNCCPKGSCCTGGEHSQCPTVMPRG